MKKPLKITPASLKSLYTEEPYHSFLRPAASIPVEMLKNTSVTSNQVTLLSAAAGIAAGIFTGYRLPAMGGIMLAISMILDCADGQLARIRGGGSRLGRILDGAADYTTAISIHTGMAVYLSSYIYPAWLWVAAGAVSMAAHCIYFDHKKQWFLSRTTPESSELDTLEGLADSADKKRSLPARIFLNIYRFYLSLQDKISPGDRVIHYIEDENRRREFIQATGPLMRRARWLGPAGHNFLITISLLLAAVVKEAPFFYILLVVSVFNLLYLSTLIRGRKLTAFTPTK